MSISEILRFSISESLNFLDRTTFFGQFLSESRFRVIIGTCIKTQVLEFRVGHSPNPKNRKQRKIFEWSELERVWVYFIWQLMTRWLLSQYCHYPLSRDSNYSNPCTTYTCFIPKRHENRHIIWYFNAGRWWVSTKKSKSGGCSDLLPFRGNWAVSFVDRW